LAITGLIFALASSAANPQGSNIHYTHGSMLRTLQEIFGVGPLLRDAAKEPDLRDMFTVFP
jgi:hypothetical protein